MLEFQSCQHIRRLMNADAAIARQIGNSKPPLFAKAVASQVAAMLAQLETKIGNAIWRRHHLLQFDVPNCHIQEVRSTRT